MTEREMREILRTLCERLDRGVGRSVRRVAVPAVVGAGMALSPGCDDVQPPVDLYGVPYDAAQSDLVYGVDIVRDLVPPPVDLYGFDDPGPDEDFGPPYDLYGVPFEVDEGPGSDDGAAADTLPDAAPDTAPDTPDDPGVMPPYMAPE